MAKFTNAELEAILSEVSVELNKATAEKVALLKDEGSAPYPEGSAPSADSASADSAGSMPSVSEGSMPSESSSSSSSGSSSSGSDSSGSAADEMSPSMPPAHPGESADAMLDQSPDMEALCAEFAKMPPEHVQAILQAAQHVLQAQQPAPAAEPSAPPAPMDAGSAAPPMDAGSAPAMKAEEGAGKAKIEAAAGKGGGQPADDLGAPSGPMNQKPSESVHAVPQEANGDPQKAASNGGGVLSPEKTPAGEFKAKLLSPNQKSEQDEKFAQLQKANEELSARIESLIGITTALVEKPIRKAVTGLDYVAKPVDAPASKNLSKTEVTKRLTEKASDPKLSKSDRELINNFYDHKVGLEKIEHLLK
jgi:hypothetical protein